MKVKEIIGKSYTIAGAGKKFTVLKTESYPASKVSKQYKKILEFKPGRLVAIVYRGVLIPNIVLEEGVARLIKVEVKGKIFDRPNAISEAIGVKDAMSSYLFLSMR